MTRKRVWLALFVATLGGAAYAADPVKDAYGDELPPGALARLGTQRFRSLDFYSGMQLMPDGKTLTAMVQSVNTLFDVTTGLPTGKVSPQKGGYSLAAHAISADGKVGATAKYDGVDVWEFSTGKQLLEIKQLVYSNENTLSLSADGKYIAIGGQVDDKMKDKGVFATVWDIAAKKEVAKLKVAQNSRCYVSLSGDGKTLATWGNHSEPNQAYDKYDPATDPNRLVQVWDVAAGKELATGRVNGGIVSVALSPDGNTLAAAPGTGEIQLWDAKTGKARLSSVGRWHIGKSITFAPDGSAFAAVADDGAIQVFETATGKSKSVTACPVTNDFLQIKGLRFTGPDRAVAVVMQNSTLVAWEIPSGKRLSPAGGLSEQVVTVGFANGDKEVLAGGTSGTMLRWDRTGKELGTFTLSLPGSTSSTVKHASPRLLAGEKIATAYAASELAVYDLPSGVQRCVLPMEGGYSGNVYFNSDRTQAVLIVPPGYAAKGKAKPYRLGKFDITAGLKGQFVELPPGEYLTSALSPDGTTLVSLRRVVAEKGEPDTLLCSIDVATGKLKTENPIKLGYGQLHATFAPDGKSVLLLKGDGTKTVVSAESLKVERSLDDKDRRNATTAALFSPDGKLVAIATGNSYGGGQTTIEVFDWASGQLKNKFTGHSQPSTCLAFSKDGTVLASGSQDTTVLLWDLSKELKD